jgi:acetyltransferase-like isoleucine patch superfamily enzyme
MSNRVNTGYLGREELLELGFTAVGTNVRISRKSSFYGVEGAIGSHVRIDDFCILKGHIEIGHHVHICGFCSISGVCGVVRLGDFSTLANRVSVYTGSDDYRADALSSSTVPEEYLETIKGDVILGRAALVGAHSVILPGTVMGDAASIGALCVIHGVIAAGAVAVSCGAGLRITGSRDVSKILKMAEQVIGREKMNEGLL